VWRPPIAPKVAGQRPPSNVYLSGGKSGPQGDAERPPNARASHNEPRQPDPVERHARIAPDAIKSKKLSDEQVPASSACAHASPVRTDEAHGERCQLCGNSLPGSASAHCEQCAGARLPDLVEALARDCEQCHLAIRIPQQPVPYAPFRVMTHGEVGRIHAHCGTTTVRLYGLVRHVQPALQATDTHWTYDGLRHAYLVAAEQLDLVVAALGGAGHVVTTGRVTWAKPGRGDKRAVALRCAHASGRWSQICPPMDS
jgi:hypothetical protein